MFNNQGFIFFIQSPHVNSPAPPPAAPGEMLLENNEYILLENNGYLELEG